MLSENIKKYRKAKKLSQEELAARLHVVRQTVSKWENSLSVPDADQLISLASILEVHVHDLLGTDAADPDDTETIAEKLAEANEKIAQFTEAERLRTEAGKVRGLLIFLTMIAVLLTHVIGNEALAIALSGILLLFVLFILYRNIGLLSLSFHSAAQTRSIKAATIFDMVLIAVAAVFGLLVKTGVLALTEKQENVFVSAMISIFIFFVGIISPRLPFNRHTGLRLPWTVQNEGAWNIAHRTLGIIAIPLGLAYMSLSFFVQNMEALTLSVFGVLIGVPGLISFVYYYKLTRG